MTLNKYFNSLLDNNGNDIQSAFGEMAKHVFDNYCLCVGNYKYWFTEIEFYYYAENHKDPFCKRKSKNPQDTKSPEIASDKLFFHYSGIDISFDNGEQDKTKHQYGGILIRGIKNSDGKEIVSGPSKVLCYLLNKTQQIEGSKLTLQEAYSPFPEVKHIAISRYGLDPKDDKDKLEFIAKAYRFYLTGTKGIKKAKKYK